MDADVVAGEGEEAAGVDVVDDVEESDLLSDDEEEVEVAGVAALSALPLPERESLR